MVKEYPRKKARPAGFRPASRRWHPRAWLLAALLIIGGAAVLPGQNDTLPARPAERPTSLGESPIIGLPRSSPSRAAYPEGAPADLTDPDLKERPQKLTVFGYYRLFGYGRNMTEPYPNLSPYERTYSVGDGYREPMLSLNLMARPNGRSAFGTELFLFTPYLGTGTEDNVFSLNLGLNFYGNFRTEAGKFGVRAGGIHWYNLSSFTIGVYQVLDRFSIFDRTPWE
ncbi:MAG: hypothetical protein KDC54_18430, partial [Lewinella sp.]|nr:hypothetical protein [Lewinella sp.]